MTLDKNTDFLSSIKELADSVRELSNHNYTEEATKHAFVLPFIHCLGYNIFNPNEVLPEMVCDLVGKQGEKIDYALIDENGKANILIECKAHRQPLSLHTCQLARYFGVSDAKIGILTNGAEYQFFADLSKENVMDTSPFFSFNMANFTNEDIEKVAKFRKGFFSPESIISRARENRCYSEIISALQEELSSPSKEFVKIITDRAGMKFVSPQKAEKYRAAISEWLKGALNIEGVGKEDDCIKGATVNDLYAEAAQKVKEIVSGAIPSQRISLKSTADYVRVYVDGAITHSICVLWLNNPRKMRVSVRIEGKETFYPLDCIGSLEKYSELLIKSACRYK